MASSSSGNPLMSQHPASEGLQAALHPLVILTISDYITRHALRKLEAPLVGGLLGQQNGREITIEHAFDCLTRTTKDGVRLHGDWFRQRLDQMRTVYKDRDLDLVGWYTVFPKSGPTPALLPLHAQMLSEYNESAILLGFHPEEVPESSAETTAAAGSRLPLTIYESNYEVADEAGWKEESGGAKGSAAPGEDKIMKDKDGDVEMRLRFREIPYEIETGEAEMISMDYVASGAANASLDPEGALLAAKGKKLAAAEGEQAADADLLSPEDEELVAALRTKANAIRMLQSRIQLIIAYLEQLPESYLTHGGAARETSSGQEKDAASTGSNYPILLSIQALVSRLALLDPSSSTDLEREILAESNDARLIELLNLVIQSASEMQDVGARFGVVESAKSLANKRPLHDSFNVTGAGDLLL